jgi:hypothetical protein
MCYVCVCVSLSVCVRLSVCVCGGVLWMVVCVCRCSLAGPGHLSLPFKKGTFHIQRATKVPKEPSRCLSLVCSAYSATTTCDHTHASARGRTRMHADARTTPHAPTRQSTRIISCCTNTATRPRLHLIRLLFSPRSSTAPTTSGLAGQCSPTWAPLLFAACRA